MDNVNNIEKDGNNELIDENKNVKLMASLPAIIEVVSDTVANSFTQYHANKIEIEKKKLEDQKELERERMELQKELEIKKMQHDKELKELSLKEDIQDYEFQKIEQAHQRKIDQNNKIYTGIILLIILVATFSFSIKNIIDSSSAQTIVTVALTIAISNNTDFIKKIFTKKKD